MTGKEKCELLKAMRREIAEANGIVYLSADCTNQDDCRGYCEKCDAEARFLDAELNRLAKEGKTIKVTGFAYRSVLDSPLLFESPFSQKQLVKDAIRLTIDYNESKEYIRGVLDMACHLDKITFEEKQEFEAKANITTLELDEPLEI